MQRVDGLRKVDGTDVFGSDETPRRSARRSGSCARPTIAPVSELGDLDAFVAASPGVVAVMTASDIPGRNVFGVIPATADQPVFAEPDRGGAVPG